MSLLRHFSSVSDKDSIIYYIDFSNRRSFRFPERFMDYGEWVEGSTTGSTGVRIGSNSIIAKAADPWGNEVNLVESFTDGSGEGSINSVWFTPDITKMYRVSVWENRVSSGGLTSDVSQYFGVQTSSATENQSLLTRTGGVLDNNPYFFRVTSFPNTAFPEGQWVLLVGHVWSVGSGVGDMHKDSGVWSANGSKMRNVNSDFVFRPETTEFRTRSLCLYRHANPNPPALHRSSYPRIDICDGNEPSIQDLLQNNTDKAFNLMNPSQESVLINGPIYEDKGLKFDGVNDYVKMDYGAGIDLGSEELTIDIWVKRVGQGIILASGWTSPSNRRFYFGFSSSMFRMGIGASSWSDDNVNNPTIPANEWSNITLVCNPYNKSVKMYLNGNDTGYVKSHAGHTTISNFVLGCNPQGNDTYLNGTIGLVRIYNKVLSDSAILANYNNFAPRFK